MNAPAFSPLVSAIMPTTCARRAFVPRAIAQFQAQTYSSKELVIVDDGTDPIADLVPDDSRIRYIRLDERRTIGAKRNAACSAARGEFISHWDDDDWFANWRLSYEVGELIRSGADACGIDRVLFHEPQSGRVLLGTSPKWADPSAKYIHAISFRKSVWLARPFEDRMIGEDVVFFCPIRNLVALGDPRYYVVTIHSGNTFAYSLKNRRMFAERDEAYLAWWQRSRGPSSPESAASQFEHEERLEMLRRFNVERWPGSGEAPSAIRGQMKDNSEVRAVALKLLLSAQRQEVKAGRTLEAAGVAAQEANALLSEILSGVPSELVDSAKRGDAKSLGLVMAVAAERLKALLPEEAPKADGA